MEKIRRWATQLVQHDRDVIGVLAVLLFVIGGFFVVMKLAVFGYNALDLGIFHQVVANISSGRWFAATIHPPSYFGDHVSPLLAAVVPFYLLMPRPETLLVLQTAVVLLGAWPLALLSRRLSPAIRLVVVGAYLLSPVVHACIAFEFEFLVFSLPLLLGALVAYEWQRFGWYLGLLLLASAVREDVGLVLVGLGVFAWIDGRSFRWRMFPLCAGLLVFFGGMALTGAVNGEQYKFLTYYSWMGSSAGEALQYLALHPWMLFVKLLRLQNLLFLITLLLLAVGAPLLRLRRTVPAVFVLLALLLTNVGADATTLRTHYAALLLPFLFWAMIAGFEQLATRPPRWLVKIFDTAAQTLPAVLLVAVSLYGLMTMSPLRPAAIATIATEARDPKTKVAASLLRDVPRDTGVAASYAFLPYFGRHTDLASLNYVFTGRRQFSNLAYTLPDATETILYDSGDYLFYAVQYKNDDEKFTGGDDRFRDLFTTRGFGITEMVDAYLLLSRGATAGLSSLYTVGSTPGRTAPTNTPGPLELLSIDGQGTSLHTEPYRVGNEAVETLPMALTWKISSVEQKPFHLRLDYRDERGRTAATRLYALGYGLFPTTEWPINTPVTVRYRFIVPQLPAGTYTLTVRAEADDGYLTLDSKLTAVVATTKQTFGSESVSLGTLNR